MAQRGVYFLANDGVIDITIAFLNSFRINSPYLPLRLIPFDDKIEKLSKLSQKYDFDIYDNSENLRRCDAIGASFYNKLWSPGQFRKFCVFEGGFDEFIYIDCDTVLLRDVSFMYQYLAKYDIIFTNSNIEQTRQWVWRESIFAANVLDAEQINFAANTGFFCSRQNALSLDEFEEKLNDGLALAQHMELMCTEQPYLNYMIVTSKLRRTSLLCLKRDRPYLNIPFELWGGSDIPEQRVPQLNANDDVLLVHWAGCWSASDKDREAYEEMRKNGETPVHETVSRTMPMKQLWTSFREIDLPNRPIDG